jgi:hypothetical protein
VALVVKRKLNNCSDSNLEIIQYNQEGIQRCLAAGADQVFFTSTFVRRHFFRIFPHLAIDSTLLPSPSPAANRHIGGLREYKAMLAAGQIKDVYDYRLKAYSELLFG